ncbi:LAGLIDADG family homing endonuclease [Candidatus Lokiarchaeum ossiferum]|uniref:LAGLIDADG family homing endonuclease n=1 Tax=Candidatus Lokiarchaeum ossiferum TaxID=2951803 RepID=UPI00352F48B3
MNSKITKGIIYIGFALTGFKIISKISESKKKSENQKLQEQRAQYSILKPMKYHGNSKYTIDEDFFSEIDSESKAYILGLIYADGSLRNNIQKRTYMLEITSSVSDILWLYKIRDLMHSNHKIYFHWNGEHGTYNLELKILKKKMYYDLIDRGVIPGKLKSYGIKFPPTEKDIGKLKYDYFASDENFPNLDDPLRTFFKPTIVQRNEYNRDIKNYEKSISILNEEWNSIVRENNILPSDLIKHFIRGYFDGDGTISHDSSRITFGFSGTKYLLNSIRVFLHEEIGLSNNKLYQNKKNSKKTSGAKSTKIGKKTFSILSYQNIKDLRKFSQFIYPNDVQIYYPDKFRKFLRKNASLSKKRITYDIKLVHNVIFDVIEFIITEFEKFEKHLKKKRITLDDIYQNCWEDSKNLFYGNFIDFLEFLNQNLNLIDQGNIGNVKDFRNQFRSKFLSFYKKNLALGTKTRKKLENVRYFAPKETKGILLSVLRSPKGKETYIEKSGKFRQILELLDFLQKVIKFKFEMIS